VTSKGHQRVYLTLEILRPHALRANPPHPRSDCVGVGGRKEAAFAKYYMVDNATILDAPYRQPTGAMGKRRERPEPCWCKRSTPSFSAR
jgi:hypothetical protein